MIDQGAMLDLQRLVRTLRTAADKRGHIPERSGSVSSQVRKDRRRERTRLLSIIRKSEREIVAWALANIPDETEQENHEHEDNEEAAAQANR